MLRVLPCLPVFSSAPVDTSPASTSSAVVESEVLAASFSCGGQPTYRDPAWLHMLGEGEDPWERFITEDQSAARQCLVEARMGTLITHQVMSVLPPRRDEPVAVLLHFMPVYDAQQPPQVIAIAVTGEVLAEPTSWMLSQTRRHRMETLGRMTMGIAHDFNNLLSGILGHAELLKELPFYTQASGASREHIDIIERAALDGAELVGKIQRFIRQEKEVRYKPLDLREILNDSITLTRPYWYNEPRRRGIQIELYTQLNAVPPISGSGSELREVFVNMILNAVQAMPHGGRLRLLCDYDGIQKRVKVVIQDTGTGMKPETRVRIFEPLFTTKGEQGTGMGLAVAYGIIQSHDGEIDVSSQFGKGSVFHLSFPVASATPAAEPAFDEQQSRQQVRVLIVDDEAMVSSVLSKLLTIRGHAVTIASSGAEALECTARHTYDIVITDLGMPEMNGRMLAERLRARYPALPILLLSGDTEPGAADTVITEVLAKPFRIEQIDAAVQRALSVS